MEMVKKNNIVISVEKLSKTDRICAEDEKEVLTYHDLYQFATENAALLTAAPEKKKHVGILLGNSIPYIKWFFTCFYAGAVVVPINAQATEYEMSNYISACDIQLLIMDSVHFQKLDDTGLEHRIDVLVIDTNEHFVYKEDLQYADCDDNGFAELITTSGSSSKPKCVMLSESNLVSNAMDIIDSLHYREDEVFLVLLPFCFASANTSQLIVSLLLGAKLVLFNKPVLPMNIANAVERYSITSTTIVPSILHLLVNVGVNKEYMHKFGGLRTICFGGGKSCDADMKKAYELFQHANITQMYGQTEASTRISHLHAKEAEIKRGSVGRPLKHIKVKIVNERLENLLPNQEGEIAVCGPNVMVGYYKNPELTKNTLVNGWLLTGDIGLQDEDGYIYIKGRKKNIIIHSGINIYPEEIENILMMSPEIQEAFVYGEESEKYGEVVIADVVLRTETGDITTKDIFNYCYAHLPQYKVPYKVNIVEQLKKTPNGKLCRKGVKTDEGK